MLLTINPPLIRSTDATVGVVLWLFTAVQLIIWTPRLSVLASPRIAPPYFAVLLYNTQFSTIAFISDDASELAKTAPPELPKAATKKLAQLELQLKEAKNSLEISPYATILREYNKLKKQGYTPHGQNDIRRLTLENAKCTNTELNKTLKMDDQVNKLSLELENHKKVQGFLSLKPNVTLDELNKRVQDLWLQIKHPHSPMEKTKITQEIQNIKNVIDFYVK